jgi:hypothetical protein
LRYESFTKKWYFVSVQVSFLDNHSRQHTYLQWFMFFIKYWRNRKWTLIYTIFEITNKRKLEAIVLCRAPLRRGLFYLSRLRLFTLLLIKDYPIQANLAYIRASINLSVIVCVHTKDL